VRQLRNAIEWIMIMNAPAAEPVRADQLPPEISGALKAGPGDTAMGHDLVLMSLREAREKFERDYLDTQLKRFQGNISKTAQFVGMERSALHRKLKSLGIAIGDKPGDDAEPLE